MAPRQQRRRLSFSAGSLARWATLRLLFWTTITTTRCWAFSSRVGQSNNNYNNYYPTTRNLPPAFCTATTTTAVAHKKASSSINKSPLSSSSRLFGCSIELVEPETQCQVVLVGCFHGSQSSAADVQAVLLNSNDNDNTVLVLELCASRFADLRKDCVLFESRNPNHQQEPDQEDETNVPAAAARVNIITDNGFHHHHQQQQQRPVAKQPWIQRYKRMIQTTAQSRGLPTAVAAAILGGVSGLQTALSNLEPGLEFVTAIQIAGRQNMDIVLADQEVDTTLHKLGQLPRNALELWNDCFRRGWRDTFGREWDALVTALLGSSSTTASTEESITLGAFLTRSDAAIRDMLRLTVIPLLALQLGNVALTQGVGRLLQQLIVMLTSPVTGDPTITSELLLTTTATAVAAATASNSVDVVVPDADFTSMVIVMAHVLVCVAGCLTVALPATRIVLRERDDQLAEGIRAACRHCTSSSGGCGRVVAVLGLLHVNGVAQRLRQNKTMPATNIAADYPVGMGEFENRGS